MTGIGKGRNLLRTTMFVLTAVLLGAVAITAQPMLLTPDSATTVDYPVVNFFWVADADYSDSVYHLQVSTASNFSSILSEDSTLTQPSGTLAGFANNSTYYWRVRTTDYGNTTSAWSTVWSFSTASTWVFPVINLTAPQNNAIGQMTETVTLKWDALAGVSQYLIHIDTNSTFASPKGFFVDGSTPSGQATGLTANTRYFWRVRAILVGGSIYPWSSTRQFKTQRFATSGTAYWKRWRTHTLTLDGPACSETGTPNPFTDYRLIVKFKQMESGGEVYTMPGYFAADGNAGETHATSGNKWRIHFMDQWPGIYSWSISFRYGLNIAASDNPADGQPLDSIDGDTGTISYHIVGDRVSDAYGDYPDFVCPSQGKVGYRPGNAIHYYMPIDYSNPILLLGAASPSNFLSYPDFDHDVAQGPTYLRTWSAHVQDWSNANLDAISTWGGNAQKGKGILGALNYLWFKGVQSLSITTMNLGSGGDENVYPFINPDSLTRYDCSKLDQWQKVFNHAEGRGIFLALKLQMQGNESLLGGSGDSLSVTRAVYCREMIARFSHNLAIGWHLGDENSQATDQQRAMARYFRSHDPFSPGNVTGPRAVLLGNPAGSDSTTFTPFFNDSAINGLSLECGIPDVHRLTRKWTYASSRGDPQFSFVVLSGIQSPASMGTPHDTGNEAYQDSIRKFALWGNLMARGGGTSYYFGSDATYGDLTFQSFRSWERMWDFNFYALRFFKNYLFPDGVLTSLMGSADTLISNSNAYCLASSRRYGFPEIVANCDPCVVYFPDGGTTDINLTGVDTERTYAPNWTTNPYLRVWWYNPRTGDTLIKGDSLLVGGVTGQTWWSIGNSPTTGEDWVAYIVPDTGNPTVGIKSRKTIAASSAGFTLQRVTTRDGWIHMTLPKMDAAASVEIVRIDGKVVASFNQSAGNRISYRCKSRGFYLVCAKSRGARMLLAKILYL